MSAAVMDERTPRFLVDRTVGRLARWLRLLGYDAVWEPTDDLAGLLALAESEKRVLLTRDTLLIERRPVRHGDVKAVLLRGDHVEEQLRQLRVEIGLRPQGSSRCLVCNAALERLTAEQARLRVPPYVAETQTEFHHCAVCDRITWPATHWENASRVLRAAGFL
jgi:uncharacterized protein with PIN domain